MLFFLLIMILMPFAAQDRVSSTVRVRLQYLVKPLKLALTQQFLVDHDAHGGLILHLGEGAWMYFVFPDVIPDDPIDHITCEVTQSKLALRAEHDFSILVLTHMSLHGFSHLFPIARVHHHLHVQKFVIVLE